MQHAYRNSGPGFGIFLLIAMAAFALVFGLGLLRPSGTVDAYESIQRLSWRITNLSAKDFTLGALTPSWIGFGMSSAPAEAPAETPAEKPEAELTYRVEAGDSLSRIAARHGVELRALAAHNGLTDPDLLKVGQTLRIPSDGKAASGAKLAPVAAAAPSPPAVSSGPPASATVPLIQVDALLAMADEELSDARFERALHTTLAVERLLGAPGDSEGAEIATRRAHMEVVRAIAYTAVENHQQVQQALAKALDADPDLQLDPTHTSPKLLSALEVAREIRASGSQSPDVALGESAAVKP